MTPVIRENGWAKGFSTPPTKKGWSNVWSAGITICTAERFHINAIECYGLNREDAEKVRDTVYSIIQQQVEAKNLLGKFRQKFKEVFFLKTKQSKELEAYKAMHKELLEEKQRLIDKRPRKGSCDCVTLERISSIIERYEKHLIP